MTTNEEKRATPSTTILMELEKVTVTTVDNTGIKTIKNTNMETLQQIFMREQAVETPLLPSQWGVVKYYRKNQYEGYIMTMPASERSVTFDLRQSRLPKEAVVPVPPLVWVFEVLTDIDGKKILTHSMFYVLKHELLSLNDAVLHAPFLNLGVSHGVCWGRDIPAAPTAKSLQNVPARFFSQPFNMDLSKHRVPMFEWTQEADPIQSDNAVHHMYEMAKQLKDAKEAGETFVYPFHTLKKGSKLTVETAAKMYLPNIFK